MRIPLSVHLQLLFDVPSDLTGDLPDESSALGQETLPPGDPGGRSPGGDLCVLVSLHSLPSSQFLRGVGSVRSVGGGRGDVLWPALMPAMMPDFCLTSFGMLAVVDG